MSIWTRISDAIAALRKGDSLSDVFGKLRTPPERRVAFAIAVIALGAKMAKADGQVTRARLFNLARQDVAGFEDYARKIRRMYGDDQTAPLCELLEGLFHIAVADGEYHPREDDFLARVAEVFGLEERRFKAVRAQFVPGADRDPYDVLGVDPEMPLDEIRKQWRRLVRETHPDAMMARGVPEEAVKLAEKRMIAINEAWDEISRQS
jgi:DnaJ like chaperone protein